jgi:DNA-binding XRE family transcriptional regulator
MGRSKLCSKTRQEVAAEYGVSRKTFSQWLKKAKIEPGPGRLRPATLKIVFGIKRIFIRTAGKNNGQK